MAAGAAPSSPLALDQVVALPGEQVRIRSKGRWPDGTTAVELSAEELAKRLVALVAPPRAIPVLRGGALASRHR